MKWLLPRLLVTVGLLSAFGPIVRAQDWQDERDRARAAELERRADEREQRREAEDARREERRQQREGRRRTKAHIVIGRDYVLPAGSSVDESILVVGGTTTIEGHVGDDVAVFGGNVSINGEIQDDLFVAGGHVRLGPKAVIHGDVTTFGGGLERDAAARVDGDVNTAHLGWPRWAPDDWGFPSLNIGRYWWSGAALAFTVGRFFLILFLSILAVMAAPRLIHNIAARLVSAPGVSALVGFGIEIFSAPAIAIVVIALIITIVGIVLLAAIPFFIAAFALLWIAGYAAVAALLGARLRGADWYVHGLRPVDVVLGSFMLSGVTLFGQFLTLGPEWMLPFAAMMKGTGWFVEYVAWTFALGAAVTAWMQRNGWDGNMVPPPLPTPTPAPSAM